MLVVLISGRGSNLQALLDAGLPVAAAISNEAEAGGLELASARGVATAVVEHRRHASREAFDAALETHRIDLVCLAGFMRLLTPWFVGRWHGRMLNIHPSLLPAFKGLDTHARALAAGVKIHGCTVHFVTPALDQGPIVIQAALPVRAQDSAQTLAARVLKLEHVIYPRAAKWFLEGRLVVGNGTVSVKDNDAGGDAQLLVSPD